MNLLERIIYDVPGGQFREFVGITTHLAPADLSLYRNLLPQPLDMPARPTVTIFLADYIKVFRWPLTRYQEWSVLLRSSFQDQEAWYPVTMPVTAWVPMKGGRHLGFPKYVVDRIELSREGEAIRGSAINKGDVQMELLFAEGHSRQLSDWERGLADNEAFFKGSCHCMVPPEVGPRVMKVNLVHKVPAKWDPVHGMVTVRVNAASTWASLLPNEGPYPGTYNHFLGGINLDAERLA